MAAKTKRSKEVAEGINLYITRDKGAYLRAGATT